MVSTFTVSTIGISTATAMGMATTLSIAATVTLISFLVAKELFSVGPSSFSQRLSRFLNVAVVPMLLLFAAVVATTIAEVL